MPSFPVNYDRYYLNQAYNTLPMPLDERFSPLITPNVGTPQPLTLYPVPTTNEVINPTPNSLSLNSVLGKTTAFTLSMPSTFVVSRQSADAVECAGANSKMLTSIPSELSAMATGVKFKFDTTVNGTAITGLSIRFSQESVYGVHTEATISAGSSCKFTF